MFAVDQLNFNHEVIVILCNAENKVGFSSLGKIRGKYPLILEAYNNVKLNVGKIEIVKNKNQTFILLPYKEKYKDESNSEILYKNIIKCFNQIKDYCKNNNIQSLFLYDFNSDVNLNWQIIILLIVWIIYIRCECNFITEIPLQRIEDAGIESNIIMDLESSIS